MSSYPPSRSLTDRLVDFFGLSISVLSLIFFIRFVNNVGVRIVYPFVPQLASGLGLTMVGVSWLLSIRSLVGVVGPVFGVWADRYGQREILAFSLIGHGLGLMWLTFVQGWTAILPFILIGISIAVLIPTLQAYVSNIVPYHRRGRSLAAVEFTWALAGIIGLPVAGIMMDRLGWRMPFWLLSVLCLIGGLLIWFRLPSELDIQTGQPDAKKVTKSFNFFQLCKRPNVLASIGVALCNSLALSCFLTTWGVWLNQAFTFEATALGFVATAISVAELGGSGLSSLFIDRVGKRRGSMIGVLGVLGLFLLLPQVSQWLGILLGVFIALGLFLEFTIVSLIALYAEQVPEARTTLFSLVTLGKSIGLAIGSAIGTKLLTEVGSSAVFILAASVCAISFGLIWRFLIEGGPEDTPHPERAITSA